MRDAIKRAHRATRAQQWRICPRCYRPFDRSEHETGCPRCNENSKMRQVPGSDRADKGPAIVRRVSPMGQSSAKAS